MNYKDLNETQIKGLVFIGLIFMVSKAPSMEIISEVSSIIDELKAGIDEGSRELLIKQIENVRTGKVKEALQ